MLLITRTATRTATEPTRFTLRLSPDGGTLADDAPLDEVAGLLVARGFTVAEVLAELRRAADRGEAMLGEDELAEVRLPHPDDVQVASKWTAVNRFRDTYAAALAAPEWAREDAEIEAGRWERAAVQIAPDAAERVCLSAEVWRLRRAREVWRDWL